METPCKAINGSSLKFEFAHSDNGVFESNESELIFALSGNNNLSITTTVIDSYGKDHECVIYEINLDDAALLADYISNIVKIGNKSL